MEVEETHPEATQDLQDVTPKLQKDSMKEHMAGDSEATNLTRLLSVDPEVS